MSIVDTIKNMDPEKLRTYVVGIVLLGAIFMLRDTLLGIITTMLGTFGVNADVGLPPGFIFFIGAVIFFGIALVIVMILQKKKGGHRVRPKDNISKGFCDICCNPRAKNVLPMDYEEEGKPKGKVFMCENCRDDNDEIKNENKEEK